MGPKSILVNLNIDEPVTPMFGAALELADRLGARIIATSCADVPPPGVGAEGVVLEVEIMEIQRREIEQRLTEIRADIDRLAGRPVAWRGGVHFPTPYVVRQARAADLVITGSPPAGLFGDGHRCVNPGKLVIETGRPLLIPANGSEQISLDTMLIAWKDTREARRAVFDALPLLYLAHDVVIVTIDREAGKRSNDSLADVAAYLQQHGIMARTHLIAEADESDQIVNYARTIRADLVVSGAYGHSRFSEWMFGGVTRTLLDDTGIAHFMSS